MASMFSFTRTLVQVLTGQMSNGHQAVRSLVVAGAGGVAAYGGYELAKAIREKAARKLAERAALQAWAKTLAALPPSARAALANSARVPTATQAEIQEDLPA